jgi:hypothetical protein
MRNLGNFYQRFYRRFIYRNLPIFYKFRKLPDLRDLRTFSMTTGLTRYRNKPLTEAQKENNRVKSSVRCRMEHIFGSMKMRMGKQCILVERERCDVKR